MRIAIAIFVVACLTLGLAWRQYYGPDYVFPVPPAISLEGKKIEPRSVRFLNHIPLIGWYSPKRVRPTFSKGNILVVDLDSQASERSDGYTFKVTMRQDDAVLHTLFFTLPEKAPRTGKVRILITGVTGKEAEALHQRNEKIDWFWLNEHYSAKIIPIL